MNPAKYNLLVIIFIQLFFRDPVDGQCQSVFQKYDNTNARGGIQQVPVSTYDSVSKCQNKCTNTQNCVALDFNRITFECFIFIDINGNPPQQGINNAVDHYVLKTECETMQCENGYSVHEGLSSEGGSYQGPQLESIETCMARCESYPTCKGFEFRRVNKDCYLYWTAVTLAPSRDAVHYVRSGCERCKVFRRYPNTHADGAVEQGQFIDTVSECVDLCTNNDQCKAFDFGTSSLRCYLHMGDFTRKFGSNVAHYEKMECGPCYSGYSYFENLRAADGAMRNADSLTSCRNICNFEIACTGFNFLTTSGTCETFQRSDVVLNQQDGSNYYARTNCYENPDDNFECSNTFQEKVGIYSKDGEVQSSTVNTPDLCKDLCRQRVDCVSVDFNVVNKICFVHTVEGPEFPFPNINKYYKRFCKECYQGYTKFEKQASGKGNLQLVIINTLEKCRSKCEEYLSCVAFEFNNVGNICYTFTANQTITYNNDVDHYVKTRCPYTTTDRPATPGVPDQTTAFTVIPTSAPVKCKATFQKIPNAFRSDGFRQAEYVNTAERCLDACRQEKNCMVAEFHTNNFQCYFHSTMGTTTFNSFVDRYVKQNCGTCYFGFTVYENARGTGGTRLTSVTTLAECRKRCIELASQSGNSCVGFDFQRTCYVYATSVELTYSEVDTHYQFTNCGTCENTFTERLNSNAVGGIQQPITFNTIDACMTACRNDPLCAAFDFTSSRCWFHNTVPTSPTFALSTTQYVKNKCGDCIEDFTEYTKARIDGPSQMQPSTIDTFAECRTACLRLQSCTGFDLARAAAGSLTTTCYITTNAPSLLRASSNELSTHYRRTDCDQPITTPTVKPGPVAICIAGFTSYASSRGIGNSIIQTDYKTPSSCRERCRSILSCTGFNYHIVTKTCYTITVSTVEYVDDIDYIYEWNSGCIEQSTPPGGTTLVPFQCVPKFAQRSNTYSLGGSPVPSAVNVPSCMMYCMNDPQCIAFDATSTGGCFVHRVYPKAIAGTSVDQYIKTPCLGCDEGFSVFEGIRSLGGQDEDFQTLDGCRMRCFQFSTCVGFDFNIITKSCTRYSSTVGNLIYDENTNHYRKSQCSGCLDTFNQARNTNMFNGNIQENIKSALACRAYCLSKTYTECTAYDWDRVRGECFTHSRVDATSSNSDVDLFTRQQCYETSTLDPSVTGKPLTCALTEFQLFAGKSSSSGIPQSLETNTVDKCMASCETLETCVAFDFSTSIRKCWIFSRQVLQLVDSNGVDHYVKRPCRPCENGFTLYQDEKGSSSDKQPGTFDLTRCRSVCEDQPSCSGFDYSRVDKECYIHFTRVDAITSSPSLGFDHYRKTNCLRCVDRFEEINGLVSTINVNAVDVSNSRQCQEVCRRLTECVASDFRSQDSKCLIHTNMEDLLDQNLIENARVTHYRRVPCNLDTFMTTTELECLKQFNQESGTYYRSGGRFQKNGASTSRETCERACRFENDCMAYEWDKRKLVCWLHYNREIASSNRVSDPNIDHYRKSAKCSSSTEPQAVVGGSNRFAPVPVLIGTLVLSAGYIVASVTKS